MKKVAVVGSGPNGLTASYTLSKLGYDVSIFESNSTPGGGCRSFEHAKTGTIHDSCSAVHPLAYLSPVFRLMGIKKHVKFIFPKYDFGHAYFDIFTTCSTRRKQIFLPFVKKGIDKFLGVAIHTNNYPYKPVSILTGFVLYATSFFAGWPIVRGGSGKIVDFLVKKNISSGVNFFYDTKIDVCNYSDLMHDFDYVVFDTDIAQVNEIFGCTNQKSQNPPPGVSRVNFVTSSPVPWADARLGEVGTVHLGGTASAMVSMQKKLRAGLLPSPTYTIVSQPSLLDASRSRFGDFHTVWAYCHVPNNYSGDPVKLVIDEIERCAPGFSKTIIAIADSTNAQMYSVYNPNYKGGDIFFGATQSLKSIFNSYKFNIPKKSEQKIFMCSSSTFPGPGVHGLCGFFSSLSLHLDSLKSQIVEDLLKVFCKA